jgi:TolB-like protein/Flp pilus assembly protein TadD
VNEQTSYNGDSLRNTAQPDGDAIAPEEVHAELRSILATDAFRRSARSSRLLQTLVEYSLAGRAAELKEYSLALEAFDRQPSFDPRADPIVRVEAGRLRKKLNEYYENQGCENTIRIVLPLRRYSAEFRRSLAAPPTALPIAAAPAPPVPRKLRVKWLLPFLPVLIVIVSVIVWEKRPTAAPGISSAGAASIAVLPFTDLGRGSTQESINDALTEELVEALSHVHALRVVSRLGSSYFKGKSEDVIEIGRRLGVRYILEGSVNRFAGHIRVIARLVNTSDGYLVWSKTFEREFQKTAPAGEQMARAIVDELRQQLGMSFQRPFAERRSSSAEAYQSFLKGVSFSRRWSAADLRKSLDFFDRSASVDPGYAPAWAGLADTYVVLAGFGGIAPSEAVEKARLAANRAIALDSGLAHAHASLAFIKAVYDWDWKAAGAEFRLAHDLDPSDARIHEAWVTGYLIPLGKFDEALKQILEAQELDPVSARINSAVGTTYFFRREYDRAIEQHQKALELDATFFPAYLALADAYTAKGMAPEAASALEKWTAAVGSPPPMPTTRELLLPWLEEASRKRLPIATLLKVHPRFDGLRSDPRFSALVKRAGLAAD